MTDTHSLREAIARLRVQLVPKAADIILVCDALEASTDMLEESQLALVRCQSKLSTTLRRLEKKHPPAFDKVAYQREYMRKRRVKRKIENAIAVQHELLWRSLCTGKLTQAEYENHASELKARAEEANI